MQDELPAPPPRPAVSDYPTLCADPARKSVVAAYLRAWRDGERSTEEPLDDRSRLLELYSAAYREIGDPAAGSDYDRRLRLLWDLCGVAHATTISPETIKQAVQWEEPEVPAGLVAEPITAGEASHRPVRVRPDGLPGLTWRLLDSVVADASRDSSFADFVSANARQVYLTPELVDWSPSCPLEVCGSSEPLTRTLILMPVRYVDLSPKPDWSLAAVAVHECAHVEWFHRDEVSDDPRLLLPVPNERNAWRVMAQFLRGQQDVSSPPAREYVQKHAEPIRESLSRAQEQMRGANRILGLPEDDELERLELPPGISDSALRGGNAAGMSWR